MKVSTSYVMSPQPTVVIVTTAHQNASGMDLKKEFSAPASAKQTALENSTTPGRSQEVRGVYLMSPYPTVVIVTTAHQKASGMDLKKESSDPASAKYTALENNITPETVLSSTITFRVQLELPSQLHFSFALSILPVTH